MLDLIPFCFFAPQIPVWGIPTKSAVGMAVDSAFGIIAILILFLYTELN